MNESPQSILGEHVFHGGATIRIGDDRDSVREQIAWCVLLDRMAKDGCIDESHEDDALLADAERHGITLHAIPRTTDDFRKLAHYILSYIRLTARTPFVIKLDGKKDNLELPNDMNFVDNVCHPSGTQIAPIAAVIDPLPDTSEGFEQLYKFVENSKSRGTLIVPTQQDRTTVRTKFIPIAAKRRVTNILYGSAERMLQRDVTRVNLQAIFSNNETGAEAMQSMRQELASFLLESECPYLYVEAEQLPPATELIRRLKETLERIRSGKNFKIRPEDIPISIGNRLARSFLFADHIPISMETAEDFVSAIHTYIELRSFRHLPPYHLAHRASDIHALFQDPLPIAPVVVPPPRTWSEWMQENTFTQFIQRSLRLLPPAADILAHPHTLPLLQIGMTPQGKESIARLLTDIRRQEGVQVEVGNDDDELNTIHSHLVSMVSHNAFGLLPRTKKTMVELEQQLTMLDVHQSNTPLWGIHVRNTMRELLEHCIHTDSLHLGSVKMSPQNISALHYNKMIRHAITHAALNRHISVTLSQKARSILLQEIDGLMFNSARTTQDIGINLVHDSRLAEAQIACGNIEMPVNQEYILQSILDPIMQKVRLRPFGSGSERIHDE